MPINYSEYPPNWKNEIRPAVLKRAKDCCEKCRVQNYSVIKREKNGTFRLINQVEWDMVYSKIKHSQYTMSGALKKLGFTKIILTIAHLDHDKLNHDVSLDRLLALCQKCHLKLDLKHHQENRKYGRNHKKNNFKLEL